MRRRVAHARRAVRMRMLRVSRRVPGVRAAARAVLADEIGQMRPPTSPKHHGPLNIRAGHQFNGSGRGRLPTVVLVATAMRPGDANVLAAAVEKAQCLAGNFRPLFVIDSGEFAPFRARGFAVEHVMDAAAYAEVNPHEPHSEYLRRRLTSIAASYGARTVLPVRAGSVPKADLLSLVGLAM